jgi:nitrite reductase/ring-hydroxylating ferredoxin subunit
MIKVATLAQLPPGCVKEVVVDGARYALYNVDGRVYASENRCPHAGAPLALGFLEGSEITCPLHMWGFDVTTGACLTDPDWAGLKTVEVHVEGEEVFLVLRAG